MTKATITCLGKTYTATLRPVPDSRPIVTVTCEETGVTGTGIWATDGIEGDLADMLGPAEYDMVCAALDKAERAG